jgi:glycerol-1-phosphatase
VPVLVDEYDGFAIDLDGVVWRGGDSIEGAAEGLSAIRAAGKPLVFLTNNAAFTPESVVERMSKGGFEAKAAEVITSAHAARDWINEHGMVGTPSFVLGEAAVIGQFRDILEVLPLTEGQRVGLVLVARDLEFTYERLHLTSQAVRNGAALIAANRDILLPVPGGFEPGTGAILAAIEAASGAQAIIVGKPELPMMKAAERRLGTDHVLMIGDQPHSDVLGARRIGWAAALVLSGVTTDSSALDPEPDYVIPSLGSITKNVKARIQPKY